MKEGTRPATGVLIVEDHAIVREALTELLNKQNDLRVVGHANSVRDAFHFLTSKQALVGIVLVDITLKGRSGLELIKDMRAQGINIPALVLSMHDELHSAHGSLRAAAMGYITKPYARE